MSQATTVSGEAKVERNRKPLGLTFAFVDYWIVGCGIIALVAFLFLSWTDPGISGISALLRGSSPGTLLLVPLAGILSILLALWGAHDRQHCRAASLLVMIAGLAGMAYYYALFDSDYGGTRAFNSLIKVEAGFWLAFLAGLGMIVQIYFPRPRYNNPWEHNWSRFGVTLSAAILFLLSWQMLVVLYWVPRYIIPRPTAIVEQFFKPEILELIWRGMLVTGYETLIGFVVAVVLGVPLAMFVAFSPFLNKTLYPAAVALEMVPKIAFAPLFITWFGLGLMPKIIVVFMVCFFPIMLNGVLAFRSLDRDVIYFAQSTGARAWTLFWKIRLPAALPQVFVGLKGAAVNATVGAVIAEWIGADEGLGFFLQSMQSRLRTDVSFALIIVLALMGLALFYVVVLAEKALVPWHVSQRVGGKISKQ